MRLPKALPLLVALLLPLSPLAACSGGGDGDGAGSNGGAGGSGGADGTAALAGDATTELLQQGLDAHTAGDLGKAESIYLEVVKGDRNNAYGYYNLGLVEQSTDRAQAAEEHYRQALAIDPNLSPALFNLAILRTAAGAFDEAVSLYQRVTTLAPENAGAHLNLGLLLQQLGRGAEADQELNLAVQLDPSLVSRLSPQ
jgi:Flp pilus assembly protein TadD